MAVTLEGEHERVRLAGGRLQAGPVAGGFEVTARLPFAAGAAMTPQAPERHVAVARRDAHRTMLDAIWAPAAVSATLIVLMFTYDTVVSDSAVLERQDYRQLRIGQTQRSVESRLPAREANDGERPEGAPADPLGMDECLFYRTRADAPSPAYRLCFRGRRLSYKDEVPIAAR